MSPSLDRSGPSDLAVRRGPAIDRVGHRFGRLVVLEYIGFSKSAWASYWKCRCDCGKVVPVSGKAMARSTGSTKSCGCLAAEASATRSWKGRGDLSHHYFQHLIHRANRAQITFEITIDEAWELFVEQEGRCALTGLEIYFGRYRPAGKDRRMGDWPRLNTASLDRIDSSAGYVAGNIQWVHKELNRMKGSLSMTEFVATCVAVAIRHDADLRRFRGNLGQ